MWSHAAHCSTRSALLSAIAFHPHLIPRLWTFLSHLTPTHSLSTLLPAPKKTPKKNTEFWWVVQLACDQYLLSNSLVRIRDV